MIKLKCRSSLDYVPRWMRPLISIRFSHTSLSLTDVFVLEMRRRDVFMVVVPCRRNYYTILALESRREGRKRERKKIPVISKDEKQKTSRAQCAHLGNPLRVRTPFDRGHAIIMQYPYHTVRYVRRGTRTFVQSTEDEEQYE